MEQSRPNTEDKTMKKTILTLSLMLIAVAAGNAATLDGSFTPDRTWDTYAKRLGEAGDAGNGVTSSLSELSGRTAAFNAGMSSKNPWTRRRARSDFLNYLARVQRAYNNATNKYRQARYALKQHIMKRGRFPAWRTHMINLNNALGSLRTGAANINRIRRGALKRF